MQSSPIGRLLLIWAVLTLALVALRPYLTERVWHWIPTDYPEWYLYADDVFGGASYVERSSPEGIQIRCNLRDPEADLEPFCGFHVYLNGSANPPTMDLSNFDSMQVEVDYEGGNEKLRFYVREFAPGYSDPANPLDTAKYMSLYVHASETTQPLTIDLQEFTVADWWVNNNNVPRQYARSSLKNVVAFGVDIAYPAALGKHQLSLERVSFRGRWISTEDWYFGILMSWVGVIVLGALIRLYQLRRLAFTLNRQKDQLQELSRVDPLTGLCNRNGLSLFLDQLSDDDPSVWPVSFLFIDVDHFKPINDTYGHGAGDHVLQRVADCMNECCRDSDKVARWGGEEFLMVMPGTASRVAVNVAERLRAVIERVDNPEIEHRHVTVSIGVSEARSRDKLATAIERADAALYNAKQSGRNRVSQDEGER